MPYITAGKSGSWEIRESRATSAGPRSRTLATFRVLTREVVERARRRASKSLDLRDLHRAAMRAGAPVAAPAPERAARQLLAELAAGRRPRPVLRRLLVDALGGDRGRVSDAARSATAWAGATPEQRAAALRDLLLLADKLPATRRGRRLRFPRLESARA